MYSCLSGWCYKSLSIIFNRLTDGKTYRYFLLVRRFHLTSFLWFLSGRPCYCPIDVNLYSCIQPTNTALWLWMLNSPKSSFPNSRPWKVLKWHFSVTRSWKVFTFSNWKCLNENVLQRSINVWMELILSTLENIRVLHCEFYFLVDGINGRFCRKFVKFNDNVLEGLKKSQYWCSRSLYQRL